MFVQKNVWGGIYKVTYLYAFPGDTVVKNPPAKARGAGLIPGLGKYPGGGNGNALQYSLPGKFQKNIYFCFIDYAKTFAWITTNWKILQEMGIPDHLTCLLRNLDAGQEAS